MGSVIPTVVDKWGQAAIPHFNTFDFLNSDSVLMHFKMLLNLLYYLAKEEHSEFEKASKYEFDCHVHLNISFLTGNSFIGRRGHFRFVLILGGLPISLGNFFATCAGIWRITFSRSVGGTGVVVASPMSTKQGGVKTVEQAAPKISLVIPVLILNIE